MKKRPKIMGIDLAGKPENPTGICYNGKKLNFINVFDDDEIIGLASIINPDLIVVDAPLSLPKGRCCLDDKCSCSENGGHFRLAEIEMRRFGRTLPLTFRGMRMLTQRGIKIADNLEEKYKVIESHPRTIQKILGFNSAREIENYFQIPEGINEHELDAALLFLCGIFYLNDDYMIFGDENEGIIILPDLKGHDISHFLV